MGSDILYQPPVGALVRRATAEAIVDDVLHKDESYWCCGNCHGAIHLGTNLSFDPSLVILFARGYGFHIQITRAEGTSRDTCIASGNDDFQDVVRVWAGQNDIRLPRAFFIDRCQAAEVVETFCRTGQRSPGVKWVNKRTTDWEFYDPDADEDDDEQGD